MRGLVAILVCAALAPACGGDDEETLRVFAAASLTDAFTELGETFEHNEDVEVEFNFAGSSALAQQILQGAEADVFVPADGADLKRIVDEDDDASVAAIMARNRLALLVEKGNPKAIGDLADLDAEGVTFVLCAREVPCGKLGAAVLDRAGVDAEPVSLEENVKGVVSKVTLGEADAGIVYQTDARAARDEADSVEIDGADDHELEAVYRVVVLEPNDHAEAWADFVTSREGQETLRTFGFLAP